MDFEDDCRFYAQEGRRNHNCYAFALGCRGGKYGHPGAAGGEPLQSLAPEAVDAALRADGLIPASTQDGELPATRKGFYLVAAVTSGPGCLGARDFHFYRQGPDGTWWHKRGNCFPRNRDAQDSVITDPRIAARDYTLGSVIENPTRRPGVFQGEMDYDVFVGFYYVPDTGLATAPSTLPASAFRLKWEEEEHAMEPIWAARDAASGLIVRRATIS